MILVCAPETTSDVWEALLRQPSWQSMHWCLQSRMIVDKVLRNMILVVEKLSILAPGLISRVPDIELVLQCNYHYLFSSPFLYSSRWWRTINWPHQHPSSPPQGGRTSSEQSYGISKPRWYLYISTTLVLGIGIDLIRRPIVVNFSY